MQLGSIEAIRPVFMIVMGVFLMLIAWRLCKTTEVWTARLIVSGSLLLGIGYALLLPLYDAGLIERFSPASGATALGWHAVKMVVMNCGWLFLGIGLAMHAKVFPSFPPPRRFSPSPLGSPAHSPLTAPRESIG
ncbi:MAG: hypothetical protein ACRCXD_17445 [Luteolibacter sp.]